MARQSRNFPSSTELPWLRMEEAARKPERHTEHESEKYERQFFKAAASVSASFAVHR